jgi:hypothetical protein
MKIKTIAPLVFVLFLAAAGYSQDNSCAYTFTYPKPDFSFCVTVWGTLASIQSPIGINHLDPVNPVEGWTGNIKDNGGGGDGFSMVPGFGIVDPHPPVVRQPHGPGTLPLIFDYGGNGYYVERIDAVPYQREITLTLTIHSCQGSVRYGTECYWYGPISKIANIRPDGNNTGNFAHSAFAAFGYVTHGVMLSVDEGDGCAGTDPNGASTTPYDICSVSNTPFVGPGAVFTSWGFQSYNGRPMSMRATYRVF